MVGCDRVSPGCDHCYAERLAPRMQATGVDGYAGVVLSTKDGPRWTGAVNVAESRLDQPFRWRKPRRVFVNSMSDLFHPDVALADIARVWAVMAASPQHTFQVLTKRPQRMASVVGDPGFERLVGETRILSGGHTWAVPEVAWPLPNVWLGTSIESGRYAFRADHLRDTPARVRFISAEPLLDNLAPRLELDGIDWLIVGGESGPGARPMLPSWARELRDLAVRRGVAFHFKQWGEWVNDPTGEVFQGTRMRRVGKKAAGRHLDGRTWDQFPRLEPCSADTNGDGDCGRRACPECGAER